MIGAIAYFGVGTLAIVVAWVLWLNHRAEVDRRRLVRDWDTIARRMIDPGADRG